MPDLLQMIMDGKLDTTFLISHRLSLEEAPKGYKMFKEQQNKVTKVVAPRRSSADSMNFPWA
jgi:threonine dehydrogenase-like Zn-dependent dehydrogenase